MNTHVALVYALSQQCEHSSGDVATADMDLPLVPGLDADRYSLPSKNKKLAHCSFHVGPAS